MNFLHKFYSVTLKLEKLENDDRVIVRIKYDVVCKVLGSVPGTEN